ncbi:hypothetical protein LptCag_1511 [Leptospirillum ferriphilum]|uniref:Uncharacterized protein n=2 Tax=Leptospirillum ferriphilum TaxID=178606 RepID=A0A094YKP3_9BACT|nr:hypothetical protein [Leptospirillum ferriphilum]KGA93801.1 hypothetical protein LptCag_1511 [Leptospirillum ferriphilum]
MMTHNPEDFDWEGLDGAVFNARYHNATHHVFTREEFENEKYVLDSSHGGENGSMDAERYRRLMWKSGRDVVVLTNNDVFELADIEDELEVIDSPSSV